MPTSPYQSKSVEDINTELQEHIVYGTITINYEEHQYLSSEGNQYELVCGYPDVANGILIEVNRVWGTKDGSFREFNIGDEVLVDTDNNIIAFTITPDDETMFYVNYRYNSGKVSGITDLGVGSVARTLIEAISRQVGSLYQSLDKIKASMYIDTAEGEDLDDLLKLVSVTRVPASLASGYVSFYRDSPSGQATVPTGSIVAYSSKEGDITYETTEDATFNDGFTMCRAPIQATEQFRGKIGNAAVGIVTKIVSSGLPASKVVNPAYYSDYEFVNLLEGKFGYSMASTPRRVVNSNTFPWIASDKGSVIVSNFEDQSIAPGNWSTSSVVITENNPSTGISRCVPSTSTGYISRSITVDLSKYSHVFLMARGSIGDTINVLVNGSTVPMYKFGATNSSTTPELAKELTLYVGAHGQTSTSTSTLRIQFRSTMTSWYDFIGVGRVLRESSTGTSDDAQTYVVNYSGKRVDLFYQNESANFFQTYDGDPSDGHVDKLMMLYQWSNNISGGNEEETDDALRERGKKALTIAAKGTKEAIENAVLAIEGISQCKVSDYNDDSTIEPGVCHVYVLASGFTVSPALYQDIIDTIENIRAAGIHVKVFSPQIRYVNFQLKLVYDDSRTEFLDADGQSALKTSIMTAINDFFSEASINEPLYFMDLVQYIAEEVDGIITGYVMWTPNVTPTYCDDNFNGTYTWDAFVMLDNPQRITGIKTGVTLVVQRGSGVTEASITLLRKSDYR